MEDGYALMRLEISHFGQLKQNFMVKTLDLKQFIHTKYHIKQNKNGFLMNPFFI